MKEALGLNDENFNFDFEKDIEDAPIGEYIFKMVDEADNFNEVVVEDDSESNQDVSFHYSSKDSEDFPTFAKLFRTLNKYELRRKVAKKISTHGAPRTFSKEELREERKKWFKLWWKKENILSWGYLDDLKVYAIKREYMVQYFKFLKDLRILLWWDIEELVKTKNIQQCLYGPEVRCHEQRLWGYIE
ncbi:hypothetical protein Hanom_Chr01g00094641 [Helianthus anomalus]